MAGQKKQVEIISRVDLLRWLQEEKNPTTKCKIRKRLRALGHKGGLRGKVIQTLKPKQLTPKQRTVVIKHNDEVSDRLIKKILLKRGWASKVIDTYTPEQRRYIADQYQLPNGRKGAR